jgi:hypothetical protein
MPDSNQTPDEVLAALQEGDQERSRAMGKTKEKKTS